MAGAPAVARGVVRRREPPRRIDRPEPGWFRKRLVPGGPRVACRIAHEGGLWQAFVNEHPQGPADADPFLAKSVMMLWTGAERIPEAEYRYLIATFRWAREHDPAHPFAHPSEPYDPGAARPVF